MDQTNHDTQADQDRKHDRHIDQHDDKRIRRHRMSHPLHLASFRQRDMRFPYLAPSAAFCPGLAPPAYQDIRLYPFLVCTGRLSRGIIPPVTWVNPIPIQNQCQFCMIFPIIPANSGIFHNSSRFWYKFRYGILLYS